MTYKLKKSELISLLKQFSQTYRVFVPDEQGRLVEFNDELEINWNIVPVWTGIKEFIYPARNMVAGSQDEQQKPIILVGVRNCDLRALKNIFDKLFLEEEPVDTVYKNFRDNIRVITIDCDTPADTCFCMSVGGNPYSDKDYDLNISLVENSILLDVGNEKGQELIKETKYDEVSAEDLKKKEDLKDTAERKVQENFKLEYDKDKFGKKIEKNKNKDFWLKKRESCMQCGGCNFC